jgi:hypothetical protein
MVLPRGRAVKALPYNYNAKPWSDSKERHAPPPPSITRAG